MNFCWGYMVWHKGVGIFVLNYLYATWHVCYHEDLSDLNDQSSVEEVAGLPSLQKTETAHPTSGCPLAMYEILSATNWQTPELQDPLVHECMYPTFQWFSTFKNYRNLHRSTGGMSRCRYENEPLTCWWITSCTEFLMLIFTANQ